MSITKQSFENINNKFFGIYFEIDQSIESELIEVKSINSHTLAEGQTEPFSLVFQTSDKRIFEQNTYKLIHPKLDEMLLFLVPIGADEQGVRYEAVFT